MSLEAERSIFKDPEMGKSLGLEVVKKFIGN